MTGEGKGLGALIVTVTVLALAGCDAAPPRAAAEEVYGPPTLSDWVEIDGRWDVTSADSEAGHALLQTVIDSDDDGPRTADLARWVDVRTGETIWERDDIGSVLHRDEDRLVVAIGSGSSRAFAALELATGETIWEVPESEVGECSGWELVAYWYGPEEETTTEEGEDDGTADATPSGTEESTGEEVEDEPPRLVLRGPDLACKSAERALLVELDATTGELTEVLRGRGTMATGWADSHLAVATWRNDSAVLRFYDDVGEQVSSLEVPASELVADTALTDLASPLELQFEQRFEDRSWLRVIWREDGTRYLVNDFLLDPEAGTATPATNDDCRPEQADGSFRSWAGSYSYESTELDWCVVMLSGGEESEVRTHHGEGTSWTLPGGEELRNWRITSCRGDVDDLTDGWPMLLSQAPDALLHAHDLLDGEVLWSLDEGDAGHVLFSTWRDPDRLIVVTEDEDGKQLLRTLRLCTGEVLDEREVAGVDVEDGWIGAAGWVVSVPLEETTLLAVFHERGTRPEAVLRASESA